MPLFVKTSGTSNSSTWPKAVSISVKTAINTWVKAKSAFVRTAAGWIQFFPKSGPYTTTFPYFSSTTTGLTPIPGLTLDTGSTVYLQKGTWIPNGFTISSYSYYVYTTSNGNINTTSSQFNAASGTLTQYATIPLSAATYDGYYIYGEIDANTTTTGVTGIETTDSNGSRYFVCRKYIPTQAAYTPAINYSYNSNTLVTTLSYTNKWNGTADYLPDSTRSIVLWYSSTIGTYTSATQIVANATYISSSSPSVSNNGTLYTVTASLTLNPAVTGRYYYAVEYEYNSKSDWNVSQYGSQSPSAYAVYGPIITQPGAFTYSIIDTSANNGPGLPVVTSSVSNNTLSLDWSGTQNANQYREYLNSGPISYTGYYPQGGASSYTLDSWTFLSSGTESITFYAYNTLNGQVAVTYGGSSNADYYQIYYQIGSNPAVLSANLTSGNIYFINVAIGTAVTIYSVVAYNNAGGSTAGTTSSTNPLTPSTKSTSITKTFDLTYTPPVPKPTNTIAPVIAKGSGTTLTVTSNGTWTYSPTSYRYQWYSVTDKGATTPVGTNSSSYNYGVNSGNTYYVIVWASNASGESTSGATSNSITPNAPTVTIPSGGSVALTGNATPGSIITASTSGWANSPTSYNVFITSSSSGTPTSLSTKVSSSSGASSTTYTITDYDAASPANNFKAFATATNSAGTSGTVESGNIITATPAATPPPTPSPTPTPTQPPCTSCSCNCAYCPYTYQSCPPNVCTYDGCGNFVGYTST